MGVKPTWGWTRYTGTYSTGEPAPQDMYEMNNGGHLFTAFWDDSPAGLTQF